MAAWASVLADAFDCDTCTRHRSGSFVCSMQDGHIDRDKALEIIAGAKLAAAMPMIFRAEAVGICPRVLLTRFASLVAKAHSWWENGQLGLTLLTAPAWVDDAFGVLTAERNKAMRYQMKSKG